ncbi:MAG: 30S ribosomal protein S3 [Candidatus Paceibacterota bacterium]|jgi:small subunit ribosomal protein S3|nr:30S ribosomal protein S3 [Candidatus Paceibacterota bacterium]
MSHKVHPKAYRLRRAGDWDSRWFNKKKLPEYLEEDFRIRQFLEKKLRDSGLEKVEIERFAGKVTVIIDTSRPGLIIGRGGKGAEELKKSLEKILPLPKDGKRELRIEIREVKNPWTSASLSAQWIAQQLEKRVGHRRAMKQGMEKIMANKEVLGARIELSGRLGGNEIARREWLRKGNLPRQTLRAIIDYHLAEARCTYGVIGVKVWIYKGEQFD